MTSFNYCKIFSELSDILLVIALIVKLLLTQYSIHVISAVLKNGIMVFPNDIQYDKINILLFHGTTAILPNSSCAIMKKPTSQLHKDYDII